MSYVAPLKGYYVRGDVLGPDGDFITSPEISQIFGEVSCTTIALYGIKTQAIWFLDPKLQIGLLLCLPADWRLDHQRVDGSRSAQTAAAGGTRTRKRFPGSRHPQSNVTLIYAVTVTHLFWQARRSQENEKIQVINSSVVRTGLRFTISSRGRPRS